jgi:hypothetical protein
MLELRVRSPLDDGYPATTAEGTDDVAAGDARCSGHVPCTVPGTVASTDDRLRKAELMRHRRHYRVPAPRSIFSGFRFLPDQVDHVTIYRYLSLGG